MNDGLMDDDNFDRMAMASQRQAEDLDPFPQPLAFMFGDQEPAWRQLSGSGLAFNDTFSRSESASASFGPDWDDAGPWPPVPASMFMRMPQPGRDDSWVVLKVLPDEVQVLRDGAEQVAVPHATRKGDLVSLTSYPIHGGARFEVTVRGEHEEDPRMLLRWFRYDSATPAPIRRPWWRRWLDRVWPARAEA